MLYVTTRNSRDAYTAHRALCELRGPNGGLYVPFRRPALTQAEVEEILAMPFSQCVAQIINLLFNTRLQPWDLDFSVGRNPVRLKPVGHRITVGECWHNPEGDIGYVVRKIADRIRVRGTEKDLGDWPQIGVRMALLFGMFGQLQLSNGDALKKPVDISVVSGDFIAPMAAWYAKLFGLPVGNIVCCCNENSAVWELFHNGELRCGNIAVKTNLPDADVVVPVSLERLIHGCGGYGETARYVDILRRGGIYRPNDVMLNRIRAGMDISVVGSKRTQEAIVNVYRSMGYLMGPYTAMQYAGLQDYRSRTGQTGVSLILAERSPACDAAALAEAVGIPEAALIKQLDLL